MSRGVTPPFETDRYQLQNGKQIGRKWKVKLKIFSKKFEKPLDKLFFIYYNNDRKKRRGNHYER